MSTTIQFDIWGSRGSRNLQASRSAIATLTACYSLVDGEDLIVLDAGHGLGSLAWALDSRPVFQEVRRVHVFVSHPHMDHWEGLKDAEWFWVPNGRELRLFGNAETLHAIRVAYAHPNFVALEILSQNHLIGFSEQVMTPDQDVRIGRFTVRGVGLHHYSGDSDRPRPVPTLGFRVWLEGGPGIAYLSDHEPRPETREIERQLLEGAHLAVFDANFPDRAPAEPRSRFSGVRRERRARAPRHAGPGWPPGLEFV